MTAHHSSHTAEERDTAAVIIESNEYEPLLPEGLETALYRTLSNQNNKDPRSEDTSDLEGANGDDDNKPKATGVYTTLSVLLLGVFVSQIDQSFVLATYGAVSSEFNDLGSGPWLISAYILAQCVAQPLYGKLSDIYGRKICLQASYVLFAIGTAGSGLGMSMGQVIAFRAVQGAGGAGMGSMVSIIIADLVPLREVATYWSYVNILQTTGRSAGGFLGGLLTQTLGWRWAFLVQVPPILLATLLVQWKLSLPSKDTDNASETRIDKLKRVDFVGALFLCLTIFTACFIIDVGGEKVAWDSPVMIAMIVTGIVSAVLFVVSAKKVKEPIFPLRLLTKYEVVTNYLVVALQVMVQLSLMMAVPLYFQATKDANTAEAGAYLIPAFVGNTLGGLLAGYWIRKTGRYKWPTVFAPVLAIGCMLLCMTWNGRTSIWSSLFIFPGGFGNGVISSSVFVGVAASVSEEDIAVVGSGLYLFFNIGAIAGASAGAAVYQTGLQERLETALSGVDGKMEIARRLVEDINYLRTLSDKIKHLAIPVFVQSFHRVLQQGLICAVVSLVIAVFTRSTTLKKK